LEGLSLPGKLPAMVHRLPKIARSGHLCASHTALGVVLEGEYPPNVAGYVFVFKVVDIIQAAIVRTLIFLLCCRGLANASVQQASSVLTFYMP
jgi:hypothetical protein